MNFQAENCKKKIRRSRDFTFFIWMVKAKRVRNNGKLAIVITAKRTIAKMCRNFVDISNNIICIDLNFSISQFMSIHSIPKKVDFRTRDENWTKYRIWFDLIQFFFLHFFHSYHSTNIVSIAKYIFSFHPPWNYFSDLSMSLYDGQQMVT